MASKIYSLERAVKIIQPVFPYLIYIQRDMFGNAEMQCINFSKLRTVLPPYEVYRLDDAIMMSDYNEIVSLISDNRDMIQLSYEL